MTGSRFLLPRMESGLENEPENRLKNEVKRQIEKRSRRKRTRYEKSWILKQGNIRLNKGKYKEKDGI